MLDEGCLSEGDCMWESLCRSWMPHQQSPHEISKVFQSMQLSQMSLDGLDKIVELIQSWDTAGVQVQAAQYKILAGCYKARKLITMPKSSDLQSWSGRADGKMLPVPKSRFEWRVWPWSQLQHARVNMSPMFRFTAGSTLWRLQLKPAKGRLGMWLELCSEPPTHQITFKLSFTGSSRQHQCAP